jgi:D-alanine-D-alanine ligase
LVRLVGWEALDPIEIMPADGPYDFDAKYIRNDTRYKVGPDLPPGVADRVRDWSLSLAAEIGVRHLCRVDYILEADSDRAWLLELNTMPGFTDHSLVPMAGPGTEDRDAGVVRSAGPGGPWRRGYARTAG